MHAALVAAALATAGINALILWVKMGRAEWNGAGLAAAAAAALFTFSGLLLLGSVALRLITFCFQRDSLMIRLGTPWRFASEIWKGARLRTAADGLSDKIPALVIEHLLFLGVVMGVAYSVIARFHEPMRMSLLIAAAVVLFMRPVAHIACLVSKWLMPLWRLLDRHPRFFGRALLLSVAMLLAAAAVLVASFSDGIFGGLNPLPLALAVAFAILFSVACAISNRLPRRFLSLFAVVLLGIGTLFSSIAIVSVSDEARLNVDRGGALGATFYGWTQKALDMDGDGFAWLIGGDCHPFDADANPFTIEIPKNGYDENCDGSDQALSHGAMADPLAAAAPVSDHLRRPRGNVLMIISDATTAGHLSIYGYAPRTMPAVARFAAKATVFDNFFAAANHTSIAMPAILTGQYPSIFPKVREREWNSFAVEKSFQPIQLRMRRAGYDTYMFAGHKLWGFLRYFAFITNGTKKRLAGKEVSKAAMNQLKKLGPSPKRPVLFAVHYIDPHHPYRAPEKPNRFGAGEYQRYDAELAYVDEAVAPILALMQKEAYKDWLVIFTSDHGESFKQHRTKYHGSNLYDEEARVPLIMRVPGAAKRHVSMAAGHLDLVPTILDWTGTKFAKDLEGSSLLPLVSKETRLAGKNRFVFAEFFRLGETYAAYDGRYSLIYKQVPNTFELYDRNHDPEQRRNIHKNGTFTAIEAALRQHVRESKARFEKADGKPAP